MTAPESPRRARREDAARGALLGTFVGDALGMPYEGCAPAAVPAELDMQPARLGRGTYTDDTQMMIALAESVLARDGVDEQHLAQAFLEIHDPRRGYGAGTNEVLALWRSGVPVSLAARQLFNGQGSLGNGAAMRIAPVGVRFADSPTLLVEQAARSARVTHAHPLGIDAAVVQAAAVAAAVRGEDVLEAAAARAETKALGQTLATVRRLLHERPLPDEVAGRVGNDSSGPGSVPAAIYAATAHANFEKSVGFAVRCGGDTDTIAAMAGAIAGARFGAEAIPVRWTIPLEDGDRGRTHVLRLAQRLAVRSLAGREPAEHTAGR